MATYAEQIAAFENKRAANIAAMDAIMAKSAEDGATLDASQQEEFDGLEKDNEAIDAHLKRLRVMHAASVAAARAVTTNVTVEGASAARAVGAAVRVMAPKVAKGAAFVRYVGALAQARGNRTEAAEIAKRWKDSTPEVEAILRTPADIIEKTAVNPGTTTDTTWASPLVQYDIMASEFIDYLRPLTILGRIAGFRRVPFKIKVPRQTAGASVNWVGEGKVKPLTSLAFDSVTLDQTKIAGIIPLSEELVRLSNPSAEALVQADLAAAITQFMDSEFIDPSNAATDVSPASVTCGLTSTVASGTTAAAFRLDVKTMFASLLVANQQISSGVWVMTQQQAVALSLMQNSLGQPEFPGITVTGGTLLGFPVVTSENIPAYNSSPTDGYPIIFLMPGEILLADDGGVSIDMSREASLQMDTAPDSPWTASTVTVNLWQHNLIAIKAERYINWKARRTTAAALIQGAHYSE
jgi:HK97 family phage major capsid protein